MGKITILVGSARDGNSLYFARKISEKYPANVIQIATKKISLCTGCLDCDETQKCVFGDEMDDLIRTMVESDVIIAISPARWGLLSGDLKLFIDRLNPIATTEELVDKRFIGVVIGQSKTDDTSIPHALKSLEYFAESAGMKLMGSFSIYECLSGDDLSKNESVVSNTVAEILKLMG